MKGVGGRALTLGQPHNRQWLGQIFLRYEAGLDDIEK